uniref:ribosomal protein L23 n=1 Tax=Nemalion vermiculare TaxID=935621 RepID=UPI002579C5EA|nr:ribosomal protein L23 [Nemalion vermiculare]WGV34447.1 ribosomal protein L23 [Nemalion vermiculare]
MHNKSTGSLIDLINKPILTDKTTKILEENQYSFTVQRKANKQEIKRAIESLFNVKIIKINTLISPVKKRTVGKFTGQKAIYKKAIVKLRAGDQISLFPE